jgi:hypothetical protein
MIRMIFSEFQLPRVFLYHLQNWHAGINHDFSLTWP